jgi:hypothetical protein
VLLRKIVQATGEDFGCPDTSEWALVAALLESYGGTPRPGDTVPFLWEKIRRALGDTSCQCGNAEWNSIQRVLEIISPGSFRTGDSKYNLLWKLLEGINSGPVDCVNLNDWGRVNSAPECFEDWGEVANPATEFEDWGSV